MPNKNFTVITVKNEIKKTLHDLAVNHNLSDQEMLKIILEKFAKEEGAT